MDIAWNFRATSAFVTDGAGETYAIAADTYPTTRSGVTFGQSGIISEVDRNSGIDRRLAGSWSRVNQFAVVSFRVDLPASGTYRISMACGDADFAISNQFFRIYDNASLLATPVNGVSAGAGQWVDATGVLRTSAADWTANNATIDLAFSSTVFKLEWAVGDGSTSGVSAIAHLRIRSVDSSFVDNTSPILRHILGSAA